MSSISRRRIRQWFTGLLVGVCAQWAAAATPTPASTPDLTGVWIITDPTPALRPPDDSSVPLTAWGRMHFEHNRTLRAKGDRSYDLSTTRCASPGAVRMMLLPYRLEIFQRPYQVTLLFEWNHLYRLLNTRTRPEVAPYPMAIGTSNGHWEGDTLVVLTTDLTDDTQLDSFGLPHSDQLQVMERFRLDGPQRLEDEMTLHDPQAFTQDWSVTLHYHKVSGRVQEDICLDRLDAGRPAFPASLD